ncbi:MAG: NAD-dependent epimerase/dehydratase family protein [Anaerolineae bacterium]
MRVLLIGGSGLISTAITRELIALGDDLTLYNRGQRQTAPPVGAKLVTGDRRDQARFTAQMAEAGTFDAVVDMVCFEPSEAASAIRALTGKTGQYIFCSTVDVYTKPALTYPIREDAERKPRATFPYALHKAECEELFFAAQASKVLPVTIIRPAYTYGEGATPLHTFGWGTFVLQRMLRGQPIIVHGDGRSLWAACHRDDVAHAFVGALGKPNTIGKAYTVAGNEWLTWDRYHEILAQALEAPPPRLVHIPSDLLGRAEPQAAMWCVENFSYDNTFDSSAAQTDLGFAYTVSWREGAKRMLRWLEAQPRPVEPEPAYYQRILDAWERLGTAFIDEVKRF